MRSKATDKNYRKLTYILRSRIDLLLRVVHVSIIQNIILNGSQNISYFQTLILILISLTVENPCPEFQSIKDYLDLEMILAGKASSLKPDKYGQKRLDELKFMYEMTKSEDFLNLKKLIIQRIMFTKVIIFINSLQKISI